MARPPGRGRGRGTGRGVGRPPSTPSEPVDQGRMDRLEAQVATLAGMFQQFMQQQAAGPSTSAPPAPPPAVPEVTPPVAPPAAPAVAEPQIDPVPPPAGPVPAATPAAASRAVPGVAAAPKATATTASATSCSAYPAADSAVNPEADRAERARAKAALLEFKKFKPQTFDGRDVDHWAVELWIDHMEKLFQDAYTEDQDRVHIAAHCLDGRASRWWRQHRARYFPGSTDISWEDFKAALYHHYLNETTKEGLERDLETIKQGDLSVKDYEQEFLRIADLVPQAVREERRKVRLFSQGLRTEIRRHLASHLSTDFDNCVERCLAIEAEIKMSRAERNAADKDKDKDKGKKRAHPGNGGGHANQNKKAKPSRPCVFCGGTHRAHSCNQRHGRCYYCGQPGHISANCPQKSAPTQPALSVPPIAVRPPSSTQSMAASSRPPPPRQTEWSRQASGGRVFALTQREDPLEEGPSNA